MNKEQKLEDINVECKDCQIPFWISAGEQKFFEDKGYPLPKRCKDCRILKKKRNLEKAS